MKPKIKTLFIIASIIIFISLVGGWTPIFEALFEFISIVIFLGILMVITILTMLGIKELKK